MEKYPESYVDVKSICPNRDTPNFLDFMNLKLEDCKGKNITSIGWWFGIFEMGVAKEWAIVTAVDPIFLDKSLVDTKLQENFEWLNTKTKWKSDELVRKLRDDVASALSSSESPDKYAEIQKKLERYDNKKAEVEEYIRKRREQIKHLESWKDNQEKYWLILNSSSGDDIHWIENSSQDIVIIAHTLSHIHKNPNINIKKFLEEWLKLLRDSWKLWIIDYIWCTQDLETKLRKTDNKEYFKENKWSFACCLDKKWLSEFLQEDIW